MSKNVKDGVLVEMSPSMLNAFDPTTSFGCERRAYFKYVMGLPEPVTGNQSLGTALHAVVEGRLQSGRVPEWGKDFAPPCTQEVWQQAMGLYITGERMVEDVAARNILKIEEPLSPFYVEGVKVKGFVDVVTDTGIIDWKTTSDLRRYGKTAEQLMSDTQMLLYAKAEHPDKDIVSLAHGQFQTRGRAQSNFVEVHVSQKHIDNQFDNVIVPLVKRIKEVVAMPSVETAAPDRKKCFNCAFRTQCPNEDGADAMASFFSKLKSATPKTEAETVELLTKSIEAVTTPEPPAEELEKLFASIKPPDAPQSEDKGTIPPPRRMKIVDVEPAVEIKTTPPPSSVEVALPSPAVTTPDSPAAKRGRPRGSKNKTEFLTPEEDVAPSIRTVSVTKGATLNLGNYNSVKFEFTLVAEGMSLGEVEAIIDAKIKEEEEPYAELVEAEAQRFARKEKK